MSETDVAEMLKLPVEERLRLVELLWNSLSANPSALPLSEAHRTAIDQELVAYRRDPDDVVPLEEVLPVPRLG